MLRRALRVVARQQPQVRGKARRHAVASAAGIDPVLLAKDGELRALYDEIASEGDGDAGESPTAAVAGAEEVAARHRAAGVSAAGDSVREATGRKRGRSDKSEAGHVAQAVDAGTTIDSLMSALRHASSSSSSSSSSSPAAALRKMLKDARRNRVDDETELADQLGKAVAAVLSLRGADASSVAGALTALSGESKGPTPGGKRPRKGDVVAEQALVVSRELARLLVLAGQRDRAGNRLSEPGKAVTSADIERAVAAELSSLTRAEVNDIKVSEVKRAVASRLGLEIEALSGKDGALRALFIAAVTEATKTRLEALAEEREVGGASSSMTDDEVDVAGEEEEQREILNGEEVAQSQAEPANVQRGEEGEAGDVEDVEEQRAEARRWTDAENAKLLALVRTHGRHWVLLSAMLDTGRTAAQCCAKVKDLQRWGLSGPLPRGKRWTQMEKSALATAVAAFYPTQPPPPGVVVDINTVDWVKVSTEVGRPADSCRHRYRMEHAEQANKRATKATGERSKVARSKSK